ncbi:MAG: GAF domain-containing protein, partial [Phycisphaeraceae bacterium]
MLDHSSQFEPPHGHASPSPPPANDPTAAPPSAGASSAPGSPTATRLALTDFLDVRTLQEMQDSFAVITRLQTTIRDADGQPVTAPTDTARRDQSDRVLEQLIDADQPDDQPYTAPIVVEGQTLGSITIEHLLDTPPPETPSRLRELAVQLGIDPADADSLIAAAEHAARPIKAAGVQFLYLMANSIARLCFKEFQLRQRVEELSVLYRLSRALARPRDVDQTIQTAANEMVQVMNVKAAAIRLLSDDATELVPRAVCNLSEQCLHTGPIRVEQSKTFTAALQGRVVCVHDIRTEPVVLDPEDAKREGLVSMLCAPMVHQDRPLGVIQLYTDQPRRFTDAETALVQTTAQLLAAYIHTARADAAQQDHLRLQRQLRLAGDVQRRLMPGVMPHLPPFDIAARYVPSLELSGDFYDFIDLDGHL